MCFFHFDGFDDDDDIDGNDYDDDWNGGGSNDNNYSTATCHNNL